MRHTLILATLLYCFPMTAQNTLESLLKHAPIHRVERFAIDSLSENQYFLRMPYAGSQFLTFLRPGAFRNALLERIDLVYTDFPAGNARRQHQLNLHRLQALERKLPERQDLSTAHWGIIVQTACTTETEARNMPHGFVLTFSETDDLLDFTMESRLENMTEGDSTVFNTLNRNTHWKKMLVVTDLTGSMSPYTAQLLLWFKLSQNTGRVNHLVFFNDGDGKVDSLKILGKTGGIYDAKPQSFKEIAELANKVVEKGTGGDEPENNVEALLYGMKACPDCEEIVMICDNWASPRDVALLRQVNKPVRVILCGTEEGVNVDYLNFARDTGGSVHTIKEDIANLMTLNEGQEINIGSEVFIIKNGKFQLFKKI